MELQRPNKVQQDEITMNRALRKRAAKLQDKAEKSLSKLRGDGFAQEAERLSTEQYIAVLSSLTQNNDDSAGQLVISLVQNMMRRTQSIEESVESRFLSIENRNQIQCAEGCSWCCRRPLVVSILDAFSVSAHLLNHPEPMELDEYLQTIEPLGNERARLNQSFDPCPFLDPQERCRVYLARPVVCRAFHSTDVEQCRSQVEVSTSERSTPMFTNLFGFRGMSLSGARQAINDLGLDERPVVLARAVKLLLEDFEGVAAAWLAGHPVFETATVDD